MTRTPALLAALLLISGCAAIPAEQRVAYDPFERLNRGTYQFNDAIDRVTLKPIAKGYNKVVPGPVRTGVTNFGRNLLTPASALNNLLQGKPGASLSELARFGINSTFGIGGLIDVAADSGIEAQTEDFGQTAAVWGVPAGPYVVLPFRGPTTLRDAVMMPLDVMGDPLYHYENTSVRDKLVVLRIVDTRARLLSLEQLLQDSKDPYVTLRESYLQNREFEVYDGDPPLDDDDEFYDEFLEEEDY